jgi:hypothetical protein
MEQDTSFSKFGKSFQEDLCHMILNDRPFADQMFEVLDINFLELKHLRVFIRKIQEYRKKYGVHPTSNIMRSIIRTGLDGEPESVKTRIRDYYARVLANGKDVVRLLHTVFLLFPKNFLQIKAEQNHQFIIPFVLTPELQHFFLWPARSKQHASPQVVRHQGSS